ncbi:MAG: catalase/peroxidase HPI [Bdellovibrionales bacterium]|nr:catalase/peroxidase HPI [Bdellovibrionales bacterium]
MIQIKTLFRILFLIVFTLPYSLLAQTKFSTGEAKPNQFWWPDLINLQALRQHSRESSPMDQSFEYSKEFKKLNIKDVKKDIENVLKDSQSWWPSDFGHYGPFFIRMAWHSAGTYRVHDGRGGAGGGQQRFEPLNSWPDNANLDKARRLLWPVKKKYGKKLSWADLMILAGNVSLESMGFQTLGFAGGRTDDWEADLVYWGPETKMLDDKRHTKKRDIKEPLAAVQMGLIYVNPEGPNGKASPLLAAKDIRRSFALMGMNDEETVALIAGGHSFGKAHGVQKASSCVGAEPAKASLEAQGLGWKNKCGTGKGKDAITSGLEGAWTSTPTKWSHLFLVNLFAFDWVQTKSLGGAVQWIPKGGKAKDTVPDAFDKSKKHAPIMFTTDLALKFDPAYEKIAQRFLKNQKEFEKAFAKAWFKLTHRDLGPRARYLGSQIPKEIFVWQDPLPEVNHKLINSRRIAKIKKQILKSDLTVSELVRTAWASASSFRGTDMRGGANGARIRLAPQKDWLVNDPKELSRVLKKLEAIQKQYKVSLADVIVLAGAVGVEQAAKKAGVSIKVPFKPGRTDATQEQTDVESFSFLEPKADAFRNYYSKDSYGSPVSMLIDKANMLNLTVPEMTVLLGGLRVLNANVEGSQHGVFTNKPGVLTNDFFVNLLDMSTKWSKSSLPGIYEGKQRTNNQLKWTATSVDLVFGSSSELRAIAEVYAADDGQKKFIQDFVKAWSKVMQLDRFDLKKI